MHVAVLKWHITLFKQVQQSRQEALKLSAWGCTSSKHFHTESFWNITIQWTSHDDLTEKICREFSIHRFWKKSWNQSAKNITKTIWQNFFLSSLKNVSKTFISIWRPNAWVDPLEKNNLSYTFYWICCRLSPFHREWPQLATN